MNVDEIRELEDKAPLPKPKDENDYDGSDYTPLAIQVAAARGTKTLIGEGGGDETVAPSQPPAPGSPPAAPGAPKLAPLPVPAANGNGNGKRPAGS